MEFTTLQLQILIQALEARYKFDEPHTVVDSMESFEASLIYEKLKQEHEDLLFDQNNTL